MCSLALQCMSFVPLISCRMISFPYKELHNLGPGFRSFLASLTIAFYSHTRFLFSSHPIPSHPPFCSPLNHCQTYISSPQSPHRTLPPVYPGVYPDRGILYPPFVHEPTHLRGYSFPLSKPSFRYRFRTLTNDTVFNAEEVHPSQYQHCL